MALPTCSMCPVSVSLSWPLARSQTLIVRSADPVTNHSLLLSNARLRTHLQDKKPLLSTLGYLRRSCPPREVQRKPWQQKGSLLMRATVCLPE